MDRRAFLGSLGVSVTGYATPVRVGLIGAGARGTYLLRESLAMPGVSFTAIAEIREDRARRAAGMVKEAKGGEPALYTRGPEDYRRLLERSDLDAVLIMTPQNQHGRQAIAALRAGKHVGSETPPAYTLDECWQLVETREKTGRHYMLLENYPYARPRLMILHMAHRGAFGEVTYGESSYIHDTRELSYEADGSLSWRGEIAHRHRGDVYPTHALAPVSLWMGINRGDRLASMVSMDNGTRGLQAYARERFGADHPAAREGFFAKRDTTITLLRTARERVIVLRYDNGTPRPAGGWEQLQGTRGAYDGSPGAQLVYLHGRSRDHAWEPLEKYRTEFEHPFWREQASAAARAGHGGGDYFVLREFYEALAEDREPAIDVYDAASWSAVLPLSGESIRAGNRSFEIPDFTRGRWKSRKLEHFGI
ncbi:MAG: Gfo/Idh/MocA family oxidoreductase [Bryobacterales bacterium]|nr:Gfo/Idh/MocA family oxidoreductase [Bryobacterales bacterium]